MLCEALDIKSFDDGDIIDGIMLTEVENNNVKATLISDYVEVQY